MKNLLNLIIDAAKNDDMNRVIELAEKQQENFCDNNCVWTDHHPDCVMAEPEWYHAKNIHGCDVFYHKSEGRRYMSGEITPLFSHPPVPTAKLKDQETLAYREAARLAEWLFKTHYSQEEHYASGRVVWELCDSTAGVISQIDNMVCQLVKPKEPEQEQSGFFSREAMKAHSDFHVAQPEQERNALPKAMNVVIAAMQADPGYAWSWHCNIAMAYVDEGVNRDVANQGAARFMKLLANVEPAHDILPTQTPDTKLNEQEPLAWESILGAVARGWCYEENANKTMDSELAVAIAKEVHALYTTPPQRTEQEQQIETLKRCLFQMQEAAKDLVEQAKSLTPPQRTWVGLDNDDLIWIYSNSDKVGQAISNTEAKLKEKNT